jgi:xanthine dehydrogenase accessory factor
MEIHQRICRLIEHPRACALILVLQAQGSTPLKAGAKAVVEQNGRIWGTIGGGEVEAQAQRYAVAACRSGQAMVFDFQMHGIRTCDSEPVCGGTMRILVSPPMAGDKQVFALVSAAVQARQRGVLLTQLSASTPPAVTMDWVQAEAIEDHTEFPDAAILRTCLASETPTLLTNPASGSEILVEPICLRPLLIITGGGHVGQALAHQAVLVGFDVTVLDDRLEFTRPELYPPGVTTQCDDMAKTIAERALTRDTFIVIVTRGHQQDALVLASCINRAAGYIGMIGSRRKIAVMRGSMIAAGTTNEAQFDRIYAPIGLDIGSVTAPEIAASIVAQLIAVRRKGIAR